jgi:hypothetical protein
MKRSTADGVEGQGEWGQCSGCESRVFVNRAQTSGGNILWFWLEDREDIYQELLEDVKELVATAVFLKVGNVCRELSLVK